MKAGHPTKWLFIVGLFHSQMLIHKSFFFGFFKDGCGVFEALIMLSISLGNQTVGGIKLERRNIFLFRGGCSCRLSFPQLLTVTNAVTDVDFFN